MRTAGPRIAVVAFASLKKRWSATAFLCLLIIFIYHRFKIAKATRDREVALPEALPARAPMGAIS